MASLYILMQCYALLSLHTLGAISSVAVLMLVVVFQNLAQPICRSHDRGRDTDPTQWVRVGVDGRGRFLSSIAVEDESDGWLVFHGMLATTRVLNGLGIGR